MQELIKFIELTKGQYAIVDEKNFEELDKLKWCCHKGYAIRTIWLAGKSYHIPMHREINKTPPAKHTDHVDGDSLDNRESNLRDCSIAENARNSKMNIKNTSGYRGVVFRKARGTWIAMIKINGKYKRGGSFKDKISAARAYDALAKKYFGEFARLNFPGES